MPAERQKNAARENLEKKFGRDARLLLRLPGRWTPRRAEITQKSGLQISPLLVEAGSLMANRLGFPLVKKYRFRIQGKKYCLGTGDLKALKLLRSMLDAEPTATGRPAWLLSFRETIREIQRLSPRAALSLVIQKSQDNSARRLAIWLRGRCGGMLGTQTIAGFRDSPNAAVRRLVARALVRMKAWALVRGMELHDPDPRVRRLAQGSQAAPSDNRLSRFLTHIPAQPVFEKPMPFQVADSRDPSAGRPPKSPSLIRIVLARLRRLIHGSPG